MQGTVTWGMSFFFFFFFLYHNPPGLGRILDHEWMSLEFSVWLVESLSAWGCLAAGTGAFIQHRQGHAALLLAWSQAKATKWVVFREGKAIFLSVFKQHLSSLLVQISVYHRGYPKAAAPGDASALPLQCYSYTETEAKPASWGMSTQSLQSVPRKTGDLHREPEVSKDSAC